MGLEQQSRDLIRYLSTAEGRAAFLSFERRELAGMLAPRRTMPQVIELLANDLTMAMQALSQRPAQEPVPAGLLEQIA